MKKVKICGVKNREDLEAICQIRPDYVGFVFAPSKRRIGLDLAKELADMVPEGVLKVGVFVNEELGIMEHFIRECSLDVVQLHGDEREEVCCRLSVPVWKSFSVVDVSDLKKAVGFKANGILLDSFSKDVRGGSGHPFPWELLGEVGEIKGDPKEWILAGGLNLTNVGEACNLPCINILDVSSGVETLGRKDTIKMKQFVDKVRDYNEQQNEDH